MRGTSKGSGATTPRGSHRLIGHAVIGVSDRLLCFRRSALTMLPPPKPSVPSKDKNTRAKLGHPRAPNRDGEISRDRPVSFAPKRHYRAGLWNGFEVDGSEKTLGGLRRERLVALGQHDPRLLTPDPKVLSRTQPRGIVQGSGSHSVQAVTGFAGAKKPATTLWANPTSLRPTAIGSGFERSRFISCEAKARNGESDRKSATR